MIIKAIKYFTKNERLPIQIINSRNTYTFRERFFINCITENGSYWGEASPLKGFNKESIQDVKSIFQNNIHDIVNTNITNKNLYTLLQLFNNAPSLKFGLEQVFLTALISEGNKPDFFTDNVSKNIKVSSLIPLVDAETFLERFVKLSNNNFKRIKIKLGRSDFEKDLFLLKKINPICVKKNILLRIDFNGKWNLLEAIEKVKKLENFNLEFIEQPVDQVEDLIELAEETPIPIAADESFYAKANIHKLLQSNVKYFIVKPMVIGGLLETLQIKKHLNNTNKKLIISSSFEGTLGLSYLLLITAIVNGKEHHGIPLFYNDPLNVFPFTIKDGIILFNLNNYLIFQKKFTANV